MKNEKYIKEIIITTRPALNTCHHDYRTCTISMFY